MLSWISLYYIDMHELSFFLWRLASGDSTGPPVAFSLDSGWWTPRSIFTAIGGVPEVRRILGSGSRREFCQCRSPFAVAGFLTLLLTFYQILSRSPSFLVCWLVGWVGRLCPSPAGVFLPEKVSLATFPVTGKLAGNFFSAFPPLSLGRPVLW